MLSFFSREYPFYKWYTIDFLEKEGRQVGRQEGRAVGWGGGERDRGSGEWKERERKEEEEGWAGNQSKHTLAISTLVVSLD